MDVFDRVILAALVIRNEIVEVIDAVNARAANVATACAARLIEEVIDAENARAAMLQPRECCASTGSEHEHGSVPAHERGHDHG